MEKRIDLTQFESMECNAGHLRGEVGYEDCPECYSDEINWILENGMTLADIITELKRSYKEIDALQGNINNARDAMNAYANDEIDNVCEAYEEVCLAFE